MNKRKQFLDRKNAANIHNNEFNFSYNLPKEGYFINLFISLLADDSDANITIKSIDGKECKGIEFPLCLKSKYFATQINNNQTTISLPYKHDIVELIVKYLHLCEIEINQYNVYDLLMAASRCGIPHLVKACFKYFYLYIVFILVKEMKVVISYYQPDLFH